MGSKEFENNGLCISGLKVCSAIVALGDKGMLLIHVDGGTILDKSITEQIKKIGNLRDIMIAINDSESNEEKANAEANRKKYVSVIQKEFKIEIKEFSFKKGAVGFVVNDDKIIPEYMSSFVKDYSNTLSGKDNVISYKYEKMRHAANMLSNSFLGNKKFGFSFDSEEDREARKKEEINRLEKEIESSKEIIKNIDAEIEKNNNRLKELKQEKKEQETNYEKVEKPVLKEAKQPPPSDIEIADSVISDILKKDRKMLKKRDEDIVEELDFNFDI